MASSFGARIDGHPLNLDIPLFGDIAVFAPAAPGRMMLVELNPYTEEIRWSRLILTKEKSELELRPKASSKTTCPKKESIGPSYSPLLTVFEDMWTRFPVVPSIERDNLELSIRLPRSLTLIVTAGTVEQRDFAAYWKRMVTVRHSIYFHFFRLSH